MTGHEAIWDVIIVVHMVLYFLMGFKLGSDHEKDVQKSELPPLFPKEALKRGKNGTKPQKTRYRRGVHSMWA